MKIWIFILAIFIILQFCFATCESKCWQVYCADPINFKLTDKFTQQDLVFGTNPRFKTDSMQLNKSPDFTIGYHPNYLSTVSGSSLGLLTSTGKTAHDTCYLRLTFTDIDTLFINYVYDNNDCCNNFGGYGKIVSIKYNGQTAAKDGENYKFEK